MLHAHKRQTLNVLFLANCNLFSFQIIQIYTLITNAAGVLRVFYKISKFCILLTLPVCTNRTVSIHSHSMLSSRDSLSVVLNNPARL